MPVVAYTLWSDEAPSSDLRVVADEIKVELTRHPRVAQVSIIGGQRRVLRVDFDREALASRNVSILQAYQALESLNWRLPAGTTAVANSEVVVDVGQFLSNADEVRDLVMNVKERFEFLPTIVMTSEQDPSMVADGMRRGAFDFLSKPVDFTRLEISLKNATHLHRLMIKVNQRSPRSCI